MPLSSGGAWAVSLSRRKGGRPAGRDSSLRGGVELGLGPGFSETTASQSTAWSLAGPGGCAGSPALPPLLTVH